MALYAVDALAGVSPSRILLVVDHDHEQVSKKLHERADDSRLEFVEAPRRGGSGDAVAMAAGQLVDEAMDDADLVVLPADTPLLRPATLRALLDHHRRSQAAATVLTVPVSQARVAPSVEDQFEILERRSDGRIIAVADEPVRWPATGPDTIERLSGVWCFRLSLVGPALRRVPPGAAVDGTSLSGLVEVLAGTGHRVEAFAIADPTEVDAVTDRLRLATAEAELRRRTNHHWMRNGVTMVDPERTYIDTTVLLGADVTLFPGTTLQGDTRIGPGAEIGPDCRLADTTVGAAAVIEKTMARDAEVGPGAHVGPFAVLDPGSHVGAAVVTGPFFHATTSEAAREAD
jgi:bifunctional UDP-N-acetylglucosamine pyrophosphorylase/glucosamine-1-phosphate N-acetyltransferase